MKAVLVIALVVAVGLGAATYMGIVDVPGPVERAVDRVLGSDDAASNPSADGDAATSGSESADGPKTPGESSTDARRLIASVKVSTEKGVPRYHVRPTRAGRTAFGDDLDEAWRQTVAKGAPDQRGLKNQFLCHPMSIIARGKSTWDLESWRPAVGLRSTILAGCNPN